MPPGGRVGAPGVVEPRDREARLSPQVPGVVDQVLVKEGQVVEAGAELVRLHARFEQAAVLAAQADLASVRAQLGKALRGARVEDLEAAEAEAGAARARAESSAVTLERTRRLLDRQAATQEELNRAQSQAASDAKTVTALAARHTALVRGSRAEDIAVARAAASQAEARLAQAKVALDRLTVTAPAAGEVLQVLVRPGEYVSSGAGAVTMGDTSILRVRLDVDERDVGRVKIGDRGFVRAEGHGDVQYEGKVVEVARRMGRKNVRTDEPTERLDTKVLEIVLELEGRPPLPQGLRVTGFIERS